MSGSGRGIRRTEIPVDYIEADPDGNRAARRMAAREARAAKQGRNTGTANGGNAVDSHSSRVDADSAANLLRQIFGGGGG